MSNSWARYGCGRRDKAEPGVIKAFVAGGAKVRQLKGKDLPDLLVGFLGVTHTVEVKTDNEALRPGQKRFRDEWTGERVEVARTPAQANKLIRMWKEAASTTRIVFPDPVQDQADGVREEEA